MEFMRQYPPKTDHDSQKQPKVQGEAVLPAASHLLLMAAAYLESQSYMMYLDESYWKLWDFKLETWLISQKIDSLFVFFPICTLSFLSRLQL